MRVLSFQSRGSILLLVCASRGVTQAFSTSALTSDLSDWLILYNEEALSCALCIVGF